MVANPANPNNVTDTDTGLIDGGPNGDIDVQLSSTLGYPTTDDVSELSVNLTATDISETINIAMVIDTSGSTAGDSGTDFDGDNINETILQAQLYAAENLFQAWISAGYTADEVNITIIDYSTGATDRGTFNLSEGTDFIAELVQMDTEGPDGFTNYEAALEAVDTAWTADGVLDTDSNLVIFMSDGDPVPGGQDFDTPARALETDFNANVIALALGANASVDDLDTVATGDAVLITSGAQLLDVVIEPLVPVDFQGFEIYIEGQLAEYIELPDARIILTPAGWALDCIDLTQYPEYTLIPGEILDVQVTAIFGDDPNQQSITNDLAIPVVVCFVQGTQILTPSGPVNVEDLAEGDRVVTRDHGAQKIKWIGNSPVEPNIMAIKPTLKPIRFAAGSLGKNLPERDLRVSRQHRFLVRDWRAEMMFGDPEGVLTPAFTLCNDSTIRVEEGDERVVYFHVAFDNHEVIYAEGVETESFYPNRQTIEGLAPEMREELLTLFPQLLDNGEPDSPYTTARDQLKARVGHLMS